jgi:glc operon protein GlcG
MSKKKVLKSLLAVFFAFCAAGASAQMPNPYGAPISTDSAKKAADAALAVARKNHWNEAVAIVDPGGTLVYFERTDNTQNASSDFAIAKARTAAWYKRPSKVFQDMVGQGGVAVRALGFPGSVPSEGGLPLVSDGKIVGGIGLSGDLGPNDSQCAQAGADAVK